MKNTFIKWSITLLILLKTANSLALEVLIYSNDFSSIEALTSGSSSTVATSSDGKYSVVQGTTTPSGTAVMGKTAYFTNTSSTGHMLFNDIPLNNGGRIVITWGSTKRNLSVNCNTTLLTGSPVSYTGSLQTSTFIIPASETGLSDFKLFTSGGSGIYFFGIEIYTNSQGPVVEACSLAGIPCTINILNATTATINVTVPYATNLTSLIPNFTLASGTSFATPADETTPKDFNSPVPYVFTDGTDSRTYTLTATRTPASTACNILSFSIPEQIATPEFKTGVKDSIIVTVPHSTLPTTIASLTPTYTTSPLVFSTVPASGTAQNFTSPVTYTITAQDGTTSKEYVVRVKKAPASTACSITDFSTGFAKEKVDINQATGAISVIVDDGEIINNITPIITKSDLSSISPTGGQNFTPPLTVTYTVTAEDGVTQKPYTVTVTQDGNGPILQTSNPEDDPTFSNAVVSLAGMISLTYNEDVFAGAGAVSISGGSGTLGTASFVGKTVQIPFSGLTSLTNYTLTIPAGVFTDYFGNPVAAKSIRFRTADGVNREFPYASKMDGASFPQPAFISGANYDINADSKATTTTQYGAYVLAPGQSLTITTSKVGTIYANVYAPGEYRTFEISDDKSLLTATPGSITNYDNNGTEIQRTINSNTTTVITITNSLTSSGDIYIPYIYISDVNQPAVDEKTQWCK